MRDSVLLCMIQYSVQYLTIRCLNLQVFTSKHLIVSTGAAQVPSRDLEKSVLKGFRGELYHSSELKRFVPEHEGKRVMIVGGGETASDIVEEWNGRVEKIVWCIPRGMHFFRKYAKLLPHRRPQALDKASSRVMKNLAPFTRSKPGRTVTIRSFFPDTPALAVAHLYRAIAFPLTSFTRSKLGVEQ